MKTYLKSILAIIAILLCACEKDPTFERVGMNDNATRLIKATATAATISANFSELEHGDLYNYDAKAYIYYSTSNNPFDGKYIMVIDDDDWYWQPLYAKTYTTTIPNLTPNTTYYYALKFNNQEGRVRSFKTLPDVSVTTETCSNLTEESVRLEASSTINEGGYLRNLGVLLCLHNPNITIDNYDYKDYYYYGKSYSSYGNNTYYRTLSFYGLYTESTYYYRAYAEGNDGKIYYGEVKSFKTLPYANIGVTTNYSENVTSTSARVRGYCTLNNGAQLAEAGILLKLHDSNVSLTNYDLYWYGTYTNFYVDFKGLYSNSTYYYRAYAKDKKGNVYYGDVKSFKTLY